jgi:hypothetical protein
MEDVSRDIVYEFLFSVLVILVTVIIIILAKKFGRIKNGAWGPELNLLTYGFLWETIISAMRGEPYWMGFSMDAKFKPLLLAFIMIGNSFLLAWNLKLDDKIPTQKGMWATWLKFSRGFLGTCSLLIFLAIDTYWE